MDVELLIEVLFHDVFVVSWVDIACWYFGTVVSLEVIAKGEFGGGGFVEIGVGVVIEWADGSGFIGAGVLDLWFGDCELWGMGEGGLEVGFIVAWAWAFVWGCAEEGVAVVYLAEFPLGGGVFV
jgi:hypothetical protein